ncbi:MAG TPA: YbaK/EbsC family protein [Pseudonocardiaceae bacterium]|jgi:prolyl-tRNA editing enzyme YbaK/EbsC (Cys-tRNA(Pro) deacylase)|nr:YbaK/EbsC family protein [Pseudonocardiaceae bacterium]
MSSAEHPGVRKVVAGLLEAGFPAAAAGLRILADDVRTAAAAAAALGVDVGAIANSLVFRAVRGDDATPLLVLTSGAHRADQDLLATIVGADRVARADAEFVRAHTGQAIGGVAPIGHPAPVPTLVDRALAAYPVVWAAAGHPKSIFPLTFAGLVELTSGTAVDVADREDDR